MVVQRDYSINPEQGPPKSILVTINLSGVDRGKAEELKDKLGESANQLAAEMLGDDVQFSVEAKVV